MSQTHAENSATLDVALQALAIPPGWLIGPRSFLVDRIQPDLERIWLPETSTGGGTLTLRKGRVELAVPHQQGLRQGLKARLKPKRPAEISQSQGWLLDLRVRNPENWAHFLNNHMTLLAAACRGFDLSWREATLILPEATPGYIRAIADLCALRCLFTDDQVVGQGVQFDVADWNALRGDRYALLGDPRLSPVAAALKGGEDKALPKRVFLSRQGGRSANRALENEAEIAALLERRGFVKLYPETLPVEDQLRLLCQAETVVAVHGAALAPLLYRRQDAPPLALVELFPVGHITNVYRAVAAAVGARWCGVRGRLEAAHLPELYQLDQPYLKHSLRNFEVDPASVEAALSEVS